MTDGVAAWAESYARLCAKYGEEVRSRWGTDGRPHPALGGEHHRKLLERERAESEAAG